MDVRSGDLTPYKCLSDSSLYSTLRGRMMPAAGQKHGVYAPAGL
jgi:hypothetical protein